MRQAPNILSCIESAMDMLSDVRHPTAYINDKDVDQVLYIIDRLSEECHLVKDYALKVIANKERIG